MLWMMYFQTFFSVWVLKQTSWALKLKQYIALTLFLHVTQKIFWKVKNPINKQLFYSLYMLYTHTYTYIYKLVWYFLKNWLKYMCTKTRRNILRTQDTKNIIVFIVFWGHLLWDSHGDKSLRNAIKSLICLVISLTTRKKPEDLKTDFSWSNFFKQRYTIYY